MQTSAARMFKNLAKSTLPPSLMQVVRRVQRYLYGYGWRKPPRLPPLPAGASAELALAHRAWELAASSPANQAGLCYYSLDFAGFPLPGERPWEARWQHLQATLPWRGARVLELGCNLGLLSTYALLAGAEAACGVDGDALLVESNRLVQQAFRVSYRTLHCNFDDARPWEDELAAFRPTVVTALSLLHWVEMKERFLRFLGRFDTVLYEGHDSDASERRRLEQAGFPDVTMVGRSEVNRAVFVARKRV